MKISGHVAHIVWVICNVYTVQVLWNVEVIFEHLFVIQNFEVTDYVLNELVAYLFDLILSKFFESKLKVSSRTFWTCRFENKCWRGRRTTPSVSWPDVCWIIQLGYDIQDICILILSRFIQLSWYQPLFKCLSGRTRMKWRCLDFRFPGHWHPKSYLLHVWIIQYDWLIAYHFF